MPNNQRGPGDLVVSFRAVLLTARILAGAPAPSLVSEAKEGVGITILCVLSIG